MIISAQWMDEYLKWDQCLLLWAVSVHLSRCVCGGGSECTESAFLDIKIETDRFNRWDYIKWEPSIFPPRSLHNRPSLHFRPIYRIHRSTDTLMYTHTQLHGKHTSEFFWGAVIKRLDPHDKSGDTFITFSLSLVWLLWLCVCVCVGTNLPL